MQKGRKVQKCWSPQLLTGTVWASIFQTPTILYFFTGKIWIIPPPPPTPTNGFPSLLESHLLISLISVIQPMKDSFWVSSLWQMNMQSMAVQVSTWWKEWPNWLWSGTFFWLSKILGTSTLSVCCLLYAHDQQYIVFLIIRLFHKDKNMAILECLAQLMVWLMETWTWGTEQREEGVWPIILDNETLDTSHAVTESITYHYQCETQVKEKKPTAEQEVLMLLTARLLPWNQTTITQWQHPL